VPAMATGPMAPPTAATIAPDRWTRNGSSLSLIVTPGELNATACSGGIMPVPSATTACLAAGKAAAFSLASASDRPRASSRSQANPRRGSWSRRLAAVKVARSARTSGGGGSSA
jgi:hypothetical protein